MRLKRACNAHVLNGMIKNVGRRLETLVQLSSEEAAQNNPR
jgi:hypothetical protein